MQPSDGMQALCAVRPAWTGVSRAGDLVRLPGRWLLHAGPPYDRLSEVPPPVLASSVLACLHEGWAASEMQAEQALRSGAIALHPAQSQRCVTPLAAVVSPSTAVALVEDAGGSVAPTFAPLGATAGPDLRFGTRDPAILERLRRRDGMEARLLGDVLGDPIDLLEIAREAVARGDDLHNRTTAATALLAERITARVGTAPTADAQRFLAALGATPLYFLTLWMAAAKLMLSATEGRSPPTVLSAMGGNGIVFGVQVAGLPGRWFVAPAAPPEGPRLPQAPADAQALGAIGDSAVIDALGFGGQALALAEEPRAALRDHLPADHAERARALLCAAHPAFAGLGLRVGFDAGRIVAAGCVPLVTLGMVAADGMHGLLGRGVYLPPGVVFERAVAAAAGSADPC